jgi:hypothetical protein
VSLFTQNHSPHSLGDYSATHDMAHNSNKGRTLSTKGIPRPHTCGPRPNSWKAGPDPVEHKRYQVWIQQKNQAQYRDEGWDISFAEWKQLWDQSGHWADRGRVKGTWCMTRRDWSLPWTVDNAMVITREEHARMQGQAIAAGWRSIAQKKRRTKLGI